MDRYEVTVARWRDAIAKGLSAPRVPMSNNGPLVDGVPGDCTYSASPMGRESYPVNCIGPQGAQAFCKFIGGDLPTEAQMEYVAQSAARSAPTRYPWGDQDPDCTNVIFGRDTTALYGGAACVKTQGTGPQAVNHGQDLDVAIGTKIANLAGNVQEITLDGFESLQSLCWASTGLFSPKCSEEDPLAFTVRGGQWGESAIATRNGWRDFIESTLYTYTGIGFRCVRAIP
jgi:formylglycine-generating enzyme required for sulfatase activity